MNILVNPFKKSLSEIKSNWQLSKGDLTKYNKSKILILVYFNVMFLVIYSILWLALISYLFLGVFYSPYAFLAVIAPIPVIFVAILVQKNVYPKMKENYLKSLK